MAIIMKAAKAILRGEFIALKYIYWKDKRNKDQKNNTESQMKPKVWFF